eukprot:gb/GECG01014889.1/.p1 GENE.gb/GECG01014889.1/~~gb/GECG01014889.1/.p1  ORF type:complete len:181 (+),score=27.05 gb/GECG01014889.1/:1-543(+)
MSDNPNRNDKKSLMETVRTERGFRDHFDSIGKLAQKVLGRGERTEDEAHTQRKTTASSSSSSKGALIVGLFAFGAIGTAATMYYRVRASSLQQKGTPMARTRTAAEAMRARSGAHSVEELTEAQQAERKEHMDRLQNLVSQWQYLIMRHQKRHPYLYLDQQHLDRQRSKGVSAASENQDR